MRTVTKPNPARQLWNWLAPPDFCPAEEKSVGLAVRFLGAISVVGVFPFLVLEWVHGWMLQFWMLCITELVLFGVLWLNRRGYSQLAALTLTLTTLVCGAGIVYLSGAGYHDISFLLFPGIPVMASLLLPRRYYLGVSGAVVLVASILILLQIYGPHPSAGPARYRDLAATIVILTVISVGTSFLVATLGVSQRFSQATIDALPEEICVLDGSGKVLAVNLAWRHFAEANPPAPPDAFVGSNYLEVCETATGRDAVDALTFAAGLRAVLSKEREEFAMEYTCPSHDGDLCFSAHVTRFPGQGAARVVVAHENITRRRQAEQALRLSEERYRGLFEQSPLGIYRTTPDGRILVANPALLEMLGCDSAEDLAARNLEESGFEPDYHRPEFKERLEREGELRGLEATWLTRQGRQLHVRENAAAIRGPDGQVAYYEGTVEDITARKLAEDEIRRTQARLRRILDNLQDAYLQAGPDGRYTMANPAAAQMFGYSSVEEVIGVHAKTFYADPGERAFVLEKLRTEGRLSDYVTRARRKDGTTFWVSLSVQPSRSDDGEIAGTEALLRDITDRKLAEEKLRLSEEQHRQLVQNLHSGVVVHAADTRIVLANEQASKLLGLSVDQMMGRTAPDPAWSFLRQDETPMPVDEYPVNRVLSSREPLRNLIAAVDRAGTGDRVWLLVNAFPEFDPEGELRQVVVTFVDVTERRRAEEERRQLQESLAQSDRLASMGMLAAGLAHEINNPLAYSLYNLESLCEDLPRYVRQLTAARQALAGRLSEPELRETLGENLEAVDAGVWLDVEARFSDALQGARRIKDLVRRLGTFSRVEKDQVTPVELRYPIESAINIASNEIKYRATVVRDIGVTAPVLGSEGRLSQVFLNLLLNAAHAIDEGDVEHNTIRVRTWQDGPTVVAEVQDTGCGIPPANLERVFDPFFTTKPAGVGSGLGLSIVRSILSGYGGTIEVESEVGRGTRFLIRLPASQEVAAEKPTTTTTTTGTAAVPTPGRVLVIDDDAGIRKSLKRILDVHEVIEAESGERACELLSTDQRFDVILCDMGMPKLSGIDVHRWLLEHHPRLARRVVFLTGGAFIPSFSDYLENVQNPRLEKPFDSANLEKIVADYLSGQGLG